MTDLGRRVGTRPLTSDEGPHRQLDQLSTPERWGRLVADTMSLPHVVEGISQVSPTTSRAVFFDDLTEIRDPAASLAPEGRLEPVHLHGVTDTSVHLVLPVERAVEVCALGWGEPHQYADFGTEVMIYGPRDDAEHAVVMRIIRESLAFARGESGHRS
jgi:hypothetical protein